jgi:hypothetical protein
MAVHGAISSKEFASSEAVARGVKPTVSEILVVEIAPMAVAWELRGLPRSANKLPLPPAPVFIASSIFR